MARSGVDADNVTVGLRDVRGCSGGAVSGNDAAVAPAFSGGRGGASAAGAGDKAVVQAAKQLLNRRLRVGIVDGRVVVGRFHCLDRQGNIILSDAMEYGLRFRCRELQSAQLQKGEPQGKRGSEKGESEDTASCGSKARSHQEAVTLERIAQQGQAGGGEDSTGASQRVEADIGDRPSQTSASGAAEAVESEGVQSTKQSCVRSGLASERVGGENLRTSEPSRQEMVGLRRLGLVLIPLSARSSCELDCSVEGQLSLLSL